jgi:hypothetical protein
MRNVEPHGAFLKEDRMTFANANKPGKPNDRSYSIGQ